MHVIHSMLTLCSQGWRHSLAELMCMPPLQHVREQQAGCCRQEQQQQPKHELQQPEHRQMQTEPANAEHRTMAATVHETPLRTVDQTLHHEAALDTPAAAAAPAQPAATASLQPQLPLSNLMQMGDTALQSELQVGSHSMLIMVMHVTMPLCSTH